MVKVSKYSIKSEAVIRRCTIKKQFWRVLNILQKKTLCMGLFWNKVAGLQPQTSFIKRLLYRCFPIKFAKYSRAPFFAKHVRVTASVKYPFVCHVNLSHQMLPLNLFFAFYFNYCQSKHFSFLNVLGNLAMNELIYCW